VQPITANGAILQTVPLVSLLVEVVRDASGELAGGGQLLRVSECLRTHPELPRAGFRAAGGRRRDSFDIASDHHATASWP
jgi:hypothetical protein